MKPDVVVVGAGPAGSAAAAGLAQRGYQVLLVDKDAFPREKACGDGLTPRAVEALRRLDLADRFAPVYEVYGVRLCEHLGGTRREMEFRRSGDERRVGWAIPRDRFDQVLCDGARDRGAELWSETLVEFVEPDGLEGAIRVRMRRAGEPVEVFAPFVVIAEGSAGRLAAPLRRTSLGASDRGFAVRQYFRVRRAPEPVFEVHMPVTMGGRTVPGYGWVFPQSDGIVNVGAGFAYGYGERGKISVRQVYREFLDLLRKAGGFDEVEPCSALIGAPLRLGLAPEECVARGVLLVGDAAALINPFTGEGIAYALESAELAVDSIDEALASGRRELWAYSVRLQERFRHHANLRNELPAHLGLFRLYEWCVEPEDRGLEISRRSRGAVAAGLGNLLWDRPRQTESELRSILFDGVLDDPLVRRMLAALEGELVAEISRISATFGEIAWRAGEAALLLPGFLGTLLMLVARFARGDEETARRIAVSAELSTLALLFHVDGARDQDRVDDPEHGSHIERVLAILIGDAAVAAVFAALNRNDPVTARAASEILSRHCAAWLARRLDTRRWIDGAPAQAPRTMPLEALARELAELVSAGAASDPRTRAPLLDYAQHLARAVQLLMELSVDLHGHGMGGESGLFLLRAGISGAHVESAERRGVDLRAFARGEAPSCRAAELALLRSGAAKVVADQAREAVAEAEHAVASFGDSGDAAILRRLTRNALRAIERVTAPLDPPVEESSSHPQGPLLDRIESPADLRGLKISDLPTVCAELRDEILGGVSATGGHLAASLGAVELLVALHYVFRTPDDRLVLDVGHQGHAHKLLTGRRPTFRTMGSADGIAKFLRRSESDFDAFGAGHAGTSISAAAGMARALEMDGSGRAAIALIGDGGLGAGMAFEALNHAGDLGLGNLAVIVNENGMSISPNVGALSRALAGEREHGVAYFAALGFTYIGPADGHDVEALVDSLQTVRGILERGEGPVLLHARTNKGNGYAPAECNPVAYHAVTAFDPGAGNPPAGSGPPSYSEVFARALLELAAADPSIAGITAAMAEGTGLALLRKELPDRFFDVGIAEQHAVTFAAGLACEGMKPVVAIYSTFLQRGYDQVVHDVCAQRLNVTFALDRAGLAGADGATHQGLYDLAYLRALPHLVILAPRDEHELRRHLLTAVGYPGPAALRYPRGSARGLPLPESIEPLPIGEAELLRDGADVMIVTLGPSAYAALRAADRLAGAGVQCAVIDARFAKPLDPRLAGWAKRCRGVVTVEEHGACGGFGSAVLELLARERVLVPVTCLAVPDRLVEHGNAESQRAEFGLDANGIVRAVEELLEAGGFARETAGSVNAGIATDRVS